MCELNDIVILAILVDFQSRATGLRLIFKFENVDLHRHLFLVSFELGESLISLAYLCTCLGYLLNKH